MQWILWLVPMFFYALTWWSTGWSLSPDGVFCLNYGQKQRVPRPYSRRWLLPMILGSRRRAWEVLSVFAVILSAILIGEYVGGSFQTKLLAELLFIGLPGIWRLNVRLPVLVDPTAFCCALGGALLLQRDYVVWGTVVICLGTCVKETVFLFAAAFAWKWPALVFGGVFAWWSNLVFNFGVDSSETWLQYPIKEARKVHDFLSPVEKILPWGAVAILLLFSYRDFTWMAAAALGLGYAQCLMAQDNARLFQWAAPVLIAVVLKHPPAWVGVAAVLGLFNPYRGT